MSFRSQRLIRPSFGLVSASLIACAGPAAAGLITFDPADGYALGTSLVVNPDWAGNGSLYSITSLGSGNGAAQSVPTVTGSAFANNRFSPDAAFLGDTDTTTAGKTYDFSFDIRFDAIGSVDGFRLDHRIAIGGTDGSPMVAFDLFGNSRLQYRTASGATNAVNINGNSLNLDDTGGRFVTVEGTIDIDAGTYDLVIDGVSQGTGLGLINTPSDFGQVTLQWRTNDAGALQYSLDNLEIAVPEPGSLALLGLGGLAMLRRR
ncbi:MAG: PEP-CTERM sorting domain-containing protein [Planctomycetota bacterium]